MEIMLYGMSVKLQLVFVMEQLIINSPAIYSAK